MPASDRPIRIVQWTTGKVAREAVKAVIERQDLELVGVYAYSKDKVGRDVGELADLDTTVGVTATDDIDALIALEPDCVIYTPLHPDVEHLTRLLRAGINIVSTASFITGRAYGEEARKALEDAAQSGKASLFGSGINPGFADYITAVASNPCREVNYVRITESFNIGLWAGDANQDALGWGRPAGDPGHGEDVVQATLPFGDAVEAIGEQLGVQLDDIRCEVSFAHAATDSDVPGRDVKKGTVAGIEARWIGAYAGDDLVEACVRWSVVAELDPAWDIAMAYLIEVQGTPQVNLRIDVLPADIATFTLEDASSMGSMITAMPAVNAVPAVVGARPGIVTYADLPTVGSRLRAKQ
jgi:2,4-diaminopentanoate dehydrogenase